MIKNRWKYSCSKNSQTSDSHALNTVSWFHAEHCESSQVFFFFCPTLCLNKSRFSSTSTFSQSCPPLVARQQLEERSCCQHCHGNWVSDSGGVGRSLFWFFFFQIFISISFPSVYSFIYFHHFSCSTMKLLNEGPTPELNHQLRKKQVNKKKKQHSPRPCLLGLVWSS